MNSGTCTATVSVLHAVVWTARCRNLTLYLNATESVTQAAANVDSSSKDVCHVPSLTLDTSAFPYTGFWWCTTP